MSGLGFGLVVALAASISAGVILALLPLLHRHAMAHPNARSSHRRATPQGAGLAVIVATLLVAAIAVAAGLRDAPFEPSSVWLVFAATAFITIVGAVDDIRPIEVGPRLLMQAFAVALMIAALPSELRVLPVLPWWIERALLLFASLWFVNLTNFMDGIDWMTIAEFVPMALGLALIGFLGALPVHGVVVALALCGGLIGFAPFNKPVARIFLGDVGSLPIGLMSAWLLLLAAGHGHLAAALVLPLYYLADATLTLFGAPCAAKRSGRRIARISTSAPPTAAGACRISLRMCSASTRCWWCSQPSACCGRAHGARRLRSSAAQPRVAWLLYRFSSPRPKQP